MKTEIMPISKVFRKCKIHKWCIIIIFVLDSILFTRCSSWMGQWCFARDGKRCSFLSLFNSEAFFSSGSSTWRWYRWAFKSVCLYVMFTCCNLSNHPFEFPIINLSDWPFIYGLVSCSYVVSWRLKIALLWGALFGLIFLKAFGQYWWTKIRYFLLDFKSWQVIRSLTHYCVRVHQ